jgi:broad specificity phosphatase PhoE
MQKTLYFISHAEVDINPAVPVTQWPLSAAGVARMTRMLDCPWVQNLTSIYCSKEQKAMDGADLLAAHLRLTPIPMATLGENDRSATGYLESAEFERAADAFFACPDRSFRGWETAVDAQSRIVQAVMDLADSDNTDGPVAIVSHGAVGTLLYCHCNGCTISRRWDQPGNGGGNYMVIRFRPEPACSWWKPIESCQSRGWE